MLLWLLALHVMPTLARLPDQSVCVAAEHEMASAEKTGMVGTSFYISPGQLHTSLDADICNDSSLH